MAVLAWLIPVSLALGLCGLLAFLWAVRTHQFDDPDGAAHRILTRLHDDHPAAGAPDHKVRASTHPTDGA
jgi:cbb3-type cytochrome oxidase maturation protein